MRKDRYRFRKEQQNIERPSQAYIYLVKNPASNESNICAWDSVLYPGTSVVVPTRYGLDLGIVTADASRIGEPRVPGSTEIYGACARCQSLEDAEPAQDEPDDEQLVAYGSPSDGIQLQMESESDQCAECGLCSCARNHRMVDIKGNMLWIERLATPSDLDRYQQLAAREAEAMKICREKIAYHKLDMKLVTAHFLLGEPKVIFFFTADVRVDFRALVKDLVSVFRIRIELRQIGVRDESRVLGGLAVCGRDYCCHAIGGKMNPVSIKMAKEQNLSLNSMKISGPCGRLLCCLAYEYDFYLEEKANYPPAGSRLKFDNELMKIQEVNILSRTITLSGSGGRQVTIDGRACFFNSESGFWEVDREYEKHLLS